MEEEMVEQMDVGVQIDQNWHEPVVMLEQWCIYRVPSKLRNVNKAAYTPQLISIGPFHHGNPKLRDMERHKIIYYEKFCEHSKKGKDELKKFIEQHIVEILRCYAGTIECDNVHIVDMILIDACFIIELFRVNSMFENHENYYILSSPWLRKAVEQDLILFENQLPYNLLQKLYDFAFPSSVPLYEEHAQEQGHSRHSHTDSTNGRRRFSCFCFNNSSTDTVAEDVSDQHQFLELTCKFFKEYSNGKPIKISVQPKHFTDLVRHFVCTHKVTEDCDSTETENKYNARKLKAAGVKFTQLREPFIVKEDKVHTCSYNLACFTDINLKLTRFKATHEAECVMRNIMALEQLMYPDKAYVCSYFLLLDQLVDTVEDVNMLIEEGIIVNLLGSNKAVEDLVNSLCVEIMEDKTCYSNICKQLNKHYEISYWKKHMATLRRVYFGNLWTGSATILGLVVFVFSIISTVQSLKSS